jgi:hypothetical protein
MLEEEDRPALQRPLSSTHQPRDATGHPYAMVYDEEIGGEHMDDHPIVRDDPQVQGSAAGASSSQSSFDLISAASRFGT